MAHEQHTTRRAFLKGAAATIVGASVAGTAAVAATDPYDQRPPEMWRQQADEMIAAYARYGVELVALPGGQVVMSIDVTRETLYDHEGVTGLNGRMKGCPRLREAVTTRVRELRHARA